MKGSRTCRWSLPSGLVITSQIPEAHYVKSKLEAPAGVCLSNLSCQRVLELFRFVLGGDRRTKAQEGLFATPLILSLLMLALLESPREPWSRPLGAPAADLPASLGLGAEHLTWAGPSHRGVWGVGQSIGKELTAQSQYQN